MNLLRNDTGNQVLAHPDPSSILEQLLDNLWPIGLTIQQAEASALLFEGDSVRGLQRTLVRSCPTARRMYDVLTTG